MVTLTTKQMQTNKYWQCRNPGTHYKQSIHALAVDRFLHQHKGKTVRIIDCTAGLGVYEDGSYGSGLIVPQRANALIKQFRDKTIHLHLNDIDESKLKILKRNIERILGKKALEPEREISDGCITTDFTNMPLSELLANIPVWNIPTLMLIDLCGIKTGNSVSFSPEMMKRFSTSVKDFTAFFTLQSSILHRLASWNKSRKSVEKFCGGKLQRAPSYDNIIDCFITSISHVKGIKAVYEVAELRSGYGYSSTMNIIGISTINNLNSHSVVIDLP